MNVVKRFASSSTAAAIDPFTHYIPVSAPYLPAVLERHVQRHLFASPSSTSIPNPFSGPARSISRRREKQLRFSEYSETLPTAIATSATAYPTAGSSSVRILSPDGTENELQWAPAELSYKQRQAAEKMNSQGTVYAQTGIHRGKEKLKFKGHKHERERPERERETRERLGGMEKRIAEWKKVCLWPFRLPGPQCTADAPRGRWNYS